MVCSMLYVEWSLSCIFLETSYFHIFNCSLQRHLIISLAARAFTLYNMCIIEMFQFEWLLSCTLLREIQSPYFQPQSFVARAFTLACVQQKCFTLNGRYLVRCSERFHLHIFNCSLQRYLIISFAAQAFILACVQQKCFMLNGRYLVRCSERSHLQIFNCSLQRYLIISLAARAFTLVCIIEKE